MTANIDPVARGGGAQRHQGPVPYAAQDSASLVALFDGLLEGGAALDVLLARAAELGGCGAGVSGPDSRHRAFDRHGAVIINRPVAASSRAIWGGHEVWIARPGPREDLDALLLERLSVACSITLRHAHRRWQGDDPPPVEVVVNQVADEADRRQAIAALGLDAGRQVRLIAYDGPVGSVADLVRQLSDPARVPWGPVGRLSAIIATGDVPVDLSVPQGARLGVGASVTATDAPVSWHEARTALRYALPSSHGGRPLSFAEAVVVPFEELGVFSLLADHLPVDQLEGNVDLAALDRLGAGPGGRDMQRTLEMVAATESLRRAAAHLHMHHNTVAHRVARAEAELGFSVSGPYGRPRLLLGLVIQRLRDNIGLSYADE